MKEKIISLLILIGLNFSLQARSELKGEELKAILNILKINESLHDHFFDYKASLVEEDAKRLNLAISQLKNQKLKEIFKMAPTELTKIKADRDREENNISYHKASLEFVKLLEEYNPGVKYNSYSCPMVKKKWVQNSESKLRVHNPYAPEMPHCGQRDTDY